MVVVSVLAHGTLATPLSAWQGRRVARAQLAGPQPPMVLDSRSRAHYKDGDGQVPSSIRVLPDQVH